MSPESVEPDALTRLRTGELLPDPSTHPVATAILLERSRIRRLWLAVEQAGPGDYFRHLKRFRAALGLES